MAVAKKKTAPAKAANDWRRDVLSRVRSLTEETAPDATEEAKWAKATNPAGVPTWSQDGILFTGETYKDKIKLTFAKGASLADPAGLFNASLDAGTRRAIDIFEGEKLNEKAFKALVRSAIAANKKPAKKAKRT